MKQKIGQTGLSYDNPGRFVSSLNPPFCSILAFRAFAGRSRKVDRAK